METDPLPSFASLLRVFRVARGLSQEILAERAGVSREAISLLERGLRLSPRRDTVSLLANTLKLSSEERARLLAAAAERRGRALPTTPITSALPASLPARLTSFVGRAKEMAEIQKLVVSKRLVTLVGPGGIGKTSLALAVAAAVHHQFAHGVALVELAALTDGNQVPPTLASVLGIREQRGEPILTTLGRALGTTQRLVVLDNCEHLLLGCARVAEGLLQASPRLTILTTSREPLRIGAEVIWRVPSLSLPLDEKQPIADLARSEAVRLFVERAGAVRPGFALTVENQAAVAEICRRLDGIPLAIELAAARVAVLTPEQIARHLTDRFTLLRSGNRTALPRHQTLRALIDWSHELLTENERIFFRRLAVFVGGWSLEAAEAVCRGAREGDRMQVSDVMISRADVLDLLVGLVDKSLVLAEERNGETRFAMLETIRVYAGDHLVASGEASDLHQRHARWALALAETSPPTVMSDEKLQVWLTRLAQDYDNLRTALHWLREAGDVEGALRLAGALSLFWQLRDESAEGKLQIEAVLALPGVTDYPVALASVRDGAGRMAHAQGDLPMARAHFESVVDYYRGIGDRESFADALTWLGAVARDEGDLAQAIQGLEEALAVLREVGNREIIGMTLLRLGSTLRDQGDLVRARSLLEESVAVYRTSGINEWLTAIAVGRLGGVVEDLGDDVRARTFYREALTYVGRIEDRSEIAFLLESFASLATKARQPARALRLVGVAARLREEIGSPLALVSFERHSRTRDLARTQLAPDVADAEQAAGRRMSLQEAVAYALADQDGDR